MAYIKRDENNKIIEYLKDGPKNGRTYINDDDPEITDFLEKTGDYSWENNATYQEKRRKKYTSDGADITTLVEKMWEYLVSEGNTSQEMDDIEDIRQQVKQDIPKE